jgi:gluconate 2-dehydrogenase gamma chain
MSEFHNRRSFLQLALSAGAAWAVVDLSEVEEALAWAAQPHAPGAAARELTVLSARDATVVDALTSRILPATDGRPGAHEAGVVYFIDRALATFNASQKKLYLDGIKDLNQRAARTLKGATSFATLTTAQQDDVLREIERTPFFQAARFDTVIGTFALPTYGGNHDYIGWQMLGLTHQSRFQPPFGYYDAEANRRS